MKPKGGLLIDVIAGPSSEDDEELADEIVAPESATRAEGVTKNPEALLDSIQTQLDQLRAQLAG